MNAIKNLYLFAYNASINLEIRKRLHGLSGVLREREEVLRQLEVEEKMGQSKNWMGGETVASLRGSAVENRNN